ncbi:SurA N-terminal domain-containing protein [Desulfogranum japonicum]|uniref:SurA N-terminal domain-containing protein n=1 Tax=Desulfogranum japonicum TaxID=231447 RepID=UPI00048F33CC|nr:SurA N-terminal domain-containing protein [Desulfogranum japonicum]
MKSLNHAPSRAMQFFTSCIMLISLALFPFTSSNAEVVDKSVAVVNNDIITMSEVNELGQPMFQKAATEVPSEQLPTVMAQIRQNVIQKLIDRKLLVQEAARLNISVSDAEVNNAIERIISRNRVSRDQFLEDLKDIGMDETQYREDLKEQILSSKLVGYEVRSKIIIPEEKIIDYYDEHYTEHLQDDGYYILQIGTETSKSDGLHGDAAKQEARKRIKKIHDLALQGKDFKELAKRYSELPSADDGGDLGTFQEKEMAPFMKKAVVGLKPGAISSVVESPSGYQFFTTLSSKEGKIISKVPYDSVKDEIRDILYDQELQSQFEQWFKDIKEKAYIRIL